MAVVLIIITFAVFIAIDWFMNHGKAPALSFAEAHGAAQEPTDEIFAGFHLPKSLRYHPGHTWVQRERKNLDRVGADEFAAIFAGPVDRVELPKPGTWVRQGQKAISFYRNGEKIEMVSPVEGEVVEVNQDLATNPALLRQDPYGNGWLMSVFAPDEEGPSRNLLPMSLISAWMHEAAEKFYLLQPMPAGATLADGGRPSEMATASMPPEVWKKAAKEFFLS
ncbi:MAG: glycine cleavage system protein H [Bryobacteraceae bacterium]|nr:glycine cleavage system protein H [Bryobacteraceae bacterium]